MIKSYWSMFYLSLFGILFSIIFLILCVIFKKKFIRFWKDLIKTFEGKLQAAFIVFGILFIFTFSTIEFIPCCKDYYYVSNNTYIETTGKVIEFTYVTKAYDTGSQKIYQGPKFYLSEYDSYIVLNTINVEVGETYLIRFYPNTRICEIVEKL